MGAIYISNPNVLYRSANIKPPRILSPTSKLLEMPTFYLKSKNGGFQIFFGGESHLGTL